MWFSGHNPRFSVITWLAIKERLSTKDRVFKIGLGSDSRCALCNFGTETHDHLLFDCPFSFGVWSNIISLRWNKRPWQD